MRGAAPLARNFSVASCSPRVAIARRGDRIRAAPARRWNGRRSQVGLLLSDLDADLIAAATRSTARSETCVRHRASISDVPVNHPLCARIARSRRIVPTINELPPRVLAPESTHRRPTTLGIDALPCALRSVSATMDLRRSRAAPAPGTRVDRPVSVSATRRGERRTAHGHPVSRLRVAQ